MAESSSVAGFALRFQEAIEAETRKLQEAIQAESRKHQEAIQAEATRLQEAIQAAAEGLAEERRALEEERAALEQEKAAMAVLSASDEDLVELSVGGREFCTTRSALTQEEGLLAAMFSGRWEASLPKDPNGRIFLDLDPDCFDKVLRSLRIRRLTGEAVDWHQVEGPSGKEDDFAELLHFIGLTPRPRSSTIGVVPMFEACAPGIVRAGMGTVSNTTQAWRWATGATVMQEGVFSWRLVLHSLPGMFICLGVIGVHPPPEHASFRHSTSYGWGRSSAVWVQGANSRGHGEWQDDFQAHDEVCMRLDADRGLLEMKVSRLGDRTFQIAGLGRHPWRVHVGMYGAGTTQLIDGDF